MEGEVLKEGQLDADGEDLGDIVGEVLAAGAEVGELLVAVAGELDAGGDEGGVELEDEAELDFEANLKRGGRKGLAVEDPGSAEGDGGGQGGKEAVALFVGKSLEFNGLQWTSPRREVSADKEFIGGVGGGRDDGTALTSRDLREGSGRCGRVARW